MAQKTSKYDEALSHAKQYIGVEKKPEDIRSAVAHMKINDRARIMHSFADGYPSACSEIKIKNNPVQVGVSLCAGTWNLGRNIIRSLIP